MIFITIFKIKECIAKLEELFQYFLDFNLKGHHEVLEKFRMSSKPIICSRTPLNDHHQLQSISILLILYIPQFKVNLRTFITHYGRQYYNVHFQNDLKFIILYFQIFNLV